MQRNGQDRQSTYNVPSRRVSATICKQWKSNKYYICWVYVCSLMHRACNAHAPYCHLRPIRLTQYFFPHYLVNGTIFGSEGSYWTKCVSILYTTFVSKLSHSKKKWARYDQQCLSSNSKVTAIFITFKSNLNFPPIPLKTTQIPDLT